MTPPMNARSAPSFLPPLWVLTLALCAAVVWVLSELREIVVLVVVGYCIAYVIDPILRLLERRKVSRPLGVFVVAGTVGAVALLLVLTALPTLVRELTTTIRAKKPIEAPSGMPSSPPISGR